jgi:hypothetical protein
MSGIGMVPQEEPQSSLLWLDATGGNQGALEIDRERGNRWQVQGWAKHRVVSSGLCGQQPDLNRGHRGVSEGF